MAFAITSPAGEDFQVWRLPKGKWKREACEYVYDNTCLLLKAFPDAQIFYEAPVGVAGRGGFNAVIPQAIVGGAFMAACCGAQLTLVENTKWKYRVLNYGKPSKEYLRTRLETRWPSAYQAAVTKRGKFDQDIIDSAWVNIYGRLILKDGA
jgi:hypothetical protein